MGELEIILSIVFLFVMAVLGSGLILFFKKINETINLIFLGLAAGIMMSSSVFSLIIPSLEMSESMGNLCWIPTAVGLIAGTALIFVLDLVAIKAGIAKVSRSSKIFFAMTFHNIPEGLAVGVAFGAFISVADPLLLASAIGLAIGVGIQNLPEGFAVSLPIWAESGSKNKAFGLGVICGAVEPVFVVIGIFLAVSLSGVLPWLLALSAGSMIMVVVAELLREVNGKAIGVWAFMLGFVIMLILENLKI